MSTKPIVPRSGKAVTNRVDLDGARIGDNWHMVGLGDGSMPDGQQVAPAPTIGIDDGSPTAAGPTSSLSPAWVLSGGDFFQNWSSTGLITTNDDWGNVPAMVGQLGQDITTVTGTNPGTLTGDSASANDVDVIANQTNPNTNATGGVAEFDGLADPTIALQGSGTADAPHVIVSLDATGEQNLVVSYRLRDLDGSADNAVQAVALQYRIGSSGAWTNVPAAFVADATSGPSLNGSDILVSATLPAAVNNQALVQIRIITTNAVGNDEWVGIDDIRVHSDHIAGGSPGSLAVSNVSHPEGDSGPTLYTFTVTRSGGSTGAVGATWTLNAPGGATFADSTDFIAGQVASGTVSFADGETTQSITISVQGDHLVETLETFSVVLSAPTGGVLLGNDTGVGTITNDDNYGSLAINDVSLAEGSSGTTAFTFTVARSGGDDGAVSADYTVNLPGGVGGADANDFQVGQIFTGTVNFAQGETSKTITVQVNGDLTIEPDETFTITLSNQQGGVTISDASGLGTILNDDSPPVVSIGDATLVEGADGVTYMVFNVTLDHVGTDPVTVNYAVTNGTATAGSDYVARTGSVSFAPGESLQTISIPIIGDTVSEANETFTVNLSSPVGGSIGDGTGQGTITNDDGNPYYSLAGGTFTQDWSNTSLITANDNWSGVPFIIGYLGDIDAGSAVNVDPRTLTGPAVGQVDVIANQNNPAGNISGGVAEFFKTDALDNVDLENATIALQGSGTADAPSIVLYMDATGRSNVRVQATLRDIDASLDDAAQQIAVQYRTSPNGPWINAPGGYFADVTTGGSATQLTAVDITLPPGADGAATLEIRFVTTNASGSDEWVGIDDIVVSSQQSGPILSIGNTAVFEGDAGTTPITFTVTRAGNPSGAVTADWTVNFPGGVNGAVAGDFAAGQLLTGQVSFADGQTSATITLNVAGDVNPELDDNFTVTLSNVVGGAIGDGSGTGTIINDDGPPPLVSINDVTVTEGNSGDSLMTFTVTRSGGTGAFDVNYQTQNGSAVANGDYDSTSGILHFGIGQTTATVTVTIHGDTDSELSETLSVILSNATNFALITDPVGVGTIAGDDPIFIHDIQGSSYFSPILAGEGIHAINVASAGSVIVRAIVTAVDNDGPRQGYYLTEEVTDWDGNSYTSEGIFVMTRNDAGVGNVVAGVTVGDLVQVSGQVMEYRHPTRDNMPSTILTNPTGFSVISHNNPLPTVTLTNMPNAVMTGVTPDYFDSTDDANDSFDASTFALSYFETVEGMLVKIPNMVVADGFVQGGQTSPFFQAYSTDSANPGQINSRGGYTISGDPPFGPPDTPTPGDDTHNGGLVLHDGDVNPDIIQLEFGGFGMAAPAGLHDNASMGDKLGDLTGIIDFDFTDRVLYVTDMNPASFVDGQTTQETTLFGADNRALTVGAFNVNNLDPGDGAARFTAIANAIAHNLNAPDIVSIEEMQDNNGAAAGDGISPTGSDASQTWQMLVDALNLATGAHYQWVDQAPVYNAEGGEQSGNIRVGFLYNTDRVQLGDLAANATLAERRQFTDRLGDGVRDAGDRIAYDDSMIAAEINSGDWSATRRSLLGEFIFHGNTVYVTANHFSAKGGSGEFWQSDQDLTAGDPLNSGWSKRNEQAQDIYTMLNLIQQSNPNVGIVSGGDYNDFYFYNPLTTMTGYTMANGTERVGGTRLTNLTLTLAEAERYTYTFDGRSQAIDHIIVNDRLAGVATYDVVHLNTGFNPANTLAISDHDPGISTFDFRNFSETLAGTAGIDLINGFDGDDIIDGGGDADVLAGGSGSDTLLGNSGNDTLAGGTDDDIVDGGTGVDTAMFASANLYFTSTAIGWVVGTSSEGTDILKRTEIAINGSGQRNLLVGATAFAGLQAALDAAVANDTVHLANATYTGTYNYDVAGLTVIAQPGAVQNLTYAPAGTEGIRVIAAGGADTITTGAGDDVLYGNAGVDHLNGGGGADFLDGGAGADVMAGGSGNDSYIVDDAGDVVTEAAGEGYDVVFTAGSYALAAGSEIEGLVTLDFNGTSAINLTGNEFANYLIGNAGANTLNGGGGADILEGRGGNDTYIVDSNADLVIEATGQGYDVVFTTATYQLNDVCEVEGLSTLDWNGTAALDLTGNALGNYMIGNDGANVMNGGGGSDVMYGRGGADIFVFADTLGAGNVDYLADFNAADDTIQLSHYAFAGLGIGALNPNAFWAGSGAHDADDRIIYNQATGQLWFDADGTGSGAAVLFANLAGNPVLTASDFVVI